MLNAVFHLILKPDKVGIMTEETETENLNNSAR